MKKKFNHKNYKSFVDKYIVHANGRVFSKQKELNYFRNNSGGKFVRLCKDGKSLSINVAKLVMLTFKPKGYSKDKIVLHKNGDIKNDSINNLKFGTRKEQSRIHVSNPKNWNRISKLGKKYGPKNGKAVGHIGAKNLFNWRLKNKIGHSEKIINRIQTMFMEGKTPSEISNKLKISRSSVYDHI